MYIGESELYLFYQDKIYSKTHFIYLKIFRSNKFPEGYTIVKNNNIPYSNQIGIINYPIDRDQISKWGMENDVDLKL